MNRVWPKLAAFVAAAIVTGLAWVQPFRIGGWGWLVPALVGPIIMGLAVLGMIYPDDPEPDAFSGAPARRNEPEDIVAVRLGQLVIGLGVIHAGIWLYFNVR